MPSSKPNLDTNVNAVNTLNAVRNDIGGSYAAQVPVAYAAGEIVNGATISDAQALQRLRDIGEAILNYKAHTNAFLDQLVNRIAATYITSRLYNNDWAFFKKGFVELGETIEELFVEIGQAHQFNPETAEKEVFKREIPDVRAAFHTVNYKKFYKVTISRQELKAAFINFAGLNDLVSKIMSAVITAANYDEKLMMKYLIAKSALNGQLAVKTIPTASLANADEIVKTMRVLALDVAEMDTQYNYAGVTTYSDLSSQRLIMTNEFTGVIDVGALAMAYNMDKANFLSQTVSVNRFDFTPAERKRLANLILNDPTAAVFTADELTALETIQAVLVDTNWFMIFDNEAYMDDIRNPEGMYYNHFYHVWKTFSASPFSVAVMLTTADSSITGLTVSPATATVAPGTSLIFTAQVQGSAFANSGVSWSVSGGTSPNTAIETNGKLIVGSNETATTLTVTATSLADPTVKGSATVTVSANTDDTSLEDGQEVSG